MNCTVTRTDITGDSATFSGSFDMMRALYLQLLDESVTGETLVLCDEDGKVVEAARNMGPVTIDFLN